MRGALSGLEARLRRMAKAAGKEDLLDAPAPTPEELDELDTQRITKAREQAFIESLPPLYTGMTFDAWAERPALAEAVATISAWAELYPCVDAGLFLYGKERGTGKTHLALAAGRAIVSKGYRVQLVDVVALLSRLRNGFEDNHPRLDVESVARWCDVMILDDLGAEKQTPWVSEQLYLLINTAIANKCALVVTSNLDYRQLAERMDDRIVSRIVGATDLLRIEGPDYRLEQHNNRREATR